MGITTHQGLHPAGLPKWTTERIWEHGTDVQTASTSREGDVVLYWVRRLVLVYFARTELSAVSEQCVNASGKAH